MQKDVEEIRNRQALLKTFAVTITERLQLIVEVQAENEAEAKEIASGKWLNGDWVLGAENFVDVEFATVSSG